ncbi:alkaline phosphatase family protein [Sutcliffiella horikoshii]|uniref:alkaline phosphatase family protein n=1 Tax=Sutcliffiella horikoshii TaxID=79883 RepID=UPI0038500C6D
MVSLQSKPIIMLVIDTLMDTPLQEAIKGDRAPALKFLMEKGKYFPDVVSPFPTMSVNVDTTILTGTYCNEHRLPGLVWFDSEENRLVNYGTHIRELWKLGISQSLEDILFHMNGSHISKDVKTIHEQIEEQGKKSASINALVYRGNTSHTYKLPRLITWFTSIKKDRPTFAPTVFTYGSLKKISGSNRFQRLWQKFGFNNSFSVQELTHLIETDQLPAFTIVYFPELDQRVHKNGRMDIQGIEKVDRHLQKLLNIYDTWEEAIQHNIWITIGDNGQAWIDSNRKIALIDLRELFGEYNIMKLKKGVQSHDQIVLAVNERMSYVYTLDKEKLSMDELVHVAKNEERIDVIAWKKGSYIEVKAGKEEGELRFRKGGPLIDSYNQSWDIEGNLNLLDMTVKGKSIHYGDYPDALERLYSSLYSHQGDFIIVSAKPGYEFIGEGSPTHVGGASHGGLHKQDSLVPLVVTGTNSQPSYLRMKEIKEWVLSLIG